MSPARRTAAPRKRPEAAGRPHLQQRVSEEQASNRDAVENGAAVGIDLEAAKQEVMRDFEALLREVVPAGDGAEEMQATLAACFETELMSLTEEQALKALDPRELKGTFRAAFNAQVGAEGDLEGAQQERLLNDALRSLDQKETQIALEFGRRVQADGQESALQWMQEQLSSAATAEKDQAGSQSEYGAATAMKSETTRSRSRRLRGPPSGS